MQDLQHHNDAAFLVLAIVLAILATVILTLTWRDSLRAIRESFPR
jgi:hypothetical protein